MPERRQTPKRRPAKPAARREPTLAGRVLDALRPALLHGVRIVMRRPAVSAGIAAFALLASGLSANAIYGQSGRHPHPLMATRDMPGMTAAGTPIPIVLAVQTELSQLGLYGGPADGRPGVLTEAAIRAFQKDAGLAVDGAVSQGLLASLRTRAPEAGSARARTIASISQRMGTVEETGSVAPAATPAPPVPLKVPAGARAVPAELASLDEKELVRRIQAGLAAAQVAQLKADGVAGGQTRTAIRTFEALEGLDVTGAPSPRILARLIEIGAAQ